MRTKRRCILLYQSESVWEKPNNSKSVCILLRFDVFFGWLWFQSGWGLGLLGCSYFRIFRERERHRRIIKNE